MKSLVVAEAYPWPPQDGYKLRLANMIEALLAEGPVDFLCLDGSGRPRDAAPAGVTVIDAPEAPELGVREWLPRWLRSGEPRRLVRRDFSAARRVLPTLDHASYDVTFFSHVDSWIRTHDLVPGRAFLDFDNLENMLLAGIRRMGPIVAPGDGPARRASATLRWLIASGFNLVDERRWDRVQRQAAATVDRVLVCSALDVDRSGCPNAVVVPNGYECDWEPADHLAVGDPERPVFLFVGLLGYGPNVDAVRWFASDVMPSIRAELPGAEFRVVGRHSESVEALGSLPGVTIVGAVDSLQPEMERADVSVVPIRSGAGTRLKVVEALANRLPMVSTAIGCEGIDVVHGEHLLIADHPVEFAAACVRLVRDPAARASLIDAGQQRYLEHYRWSAIRSEVASLATAIAGQSHPR
ncbi:MAG: glycosyltransferase family 4 protein [Acidimicrobiales bacterium]